MATPENIHQVYIANQITSNAATDLIYFGQSPYGITNDAAMTYANFAAQFGAPYTAAALTKTNDTNVTLTLGGTPTAALLQASSLTLGWTGQLGFTRGGTNASLTASNGGMVYSSATAMAILAANASAGFPILSGGAGAPTWATTIKVDSNGNFINTYGVADQSYSYQVVTTGFTVTPAAGVASLTLAPSGTIATGTISLASLAPIDGQIFEVNAVNTVTALTISGATVNNAPTTLVAGQGFQLKYNLAHTAWNVQYQASTGGAASPWTAGSGTDSAIGGDGTATATGNEAICYGTNSPTAGGPSNFSFGRSTTTAGNYSWAIGNNSTTGGSYGWSFGYLAVSTNAGSVVWADSTGTSHTDSTTNQWVLNYNGGYYFYYSSLSISTVGYGLQVKEGSNAKQGVVTLSSGVGVVSNTSVTASSRIFYCAQDTNTIGFLTITARSAGSGFTITSSVLTDSGVVAYEIFEPS